MTFEEFKELLIAECVRQHAYVADIGLTDGDEVLIDGTISLRALWDALETWRAQ